MHILHVKHFLTICWKKYNWNKVVFYYPLCDDAELVEKISLNEWLHDDQNYFDIVAFVVWLWLKGPLLTYVLNHEAVYSPSTRHYQAIADETEQIKHKIKITHKFKHMHF